MVNWVKPENRKDKRQISPIYNSTIYYLRHQRTFRPLIITNKINILKFDYN